MALWMFNLSLEAMELIEELEVAVFESQCDFSVFYHRSIPVSQIKGRVNPTLVLSVAEPQCGKGSVNPKEGRQKKNARQKQMSLVLMDRWSK